MNDVMLEIASTITSALEKKNIQKSTGSYGEEIIINFKHDGETYVVAIAMYKDLPKLEQVRYGRQPTPERPTKL